MGGEELFSAKELTVDAGTKITIRDNGAYGLIAVQGSGWVGKHRLHTPAMIRFGELTEDEVFVGYDAARAGVVFDNTGTEPLVMLRYFGPDTNLQATQVGDHRKRLMAGSRDISVCAGTDKNVCSTSIWGSG